MDAVCVTASYPGLLHGVHRFLRSRSENRLHIYNGPGYKASMSHEMLFHTARNIVMKQNEVYEVRPSPTAALDNTTEKVALQDNPGYGVTPANPIELQDNPGYGVTPANPIELQDNPGYGVIPANPIKMQDNPGYGVISANHSQRAENFAQSHLLERDYV